MNTHASYDPANVWNVVREWPPRQRLSLATRILQSLDRESEMEIVPQERQEALSRLIGACTTETPPTDQEVEQIIEEERMKKYG